MWWCDILQSIISEFCTLVNLLLMCSHVHIRDYVVVAVCVWEMYHRNPSLNMAHYMLYPTPDIDGWYCVHCLKLTNLVLIYCACARSKPEDILQRCVHIMLVYFVPTGKACLWIIDHTPSYKARNWKMETGEWKLENSRAHDRMQNGNWKIEGCTIEWRMESGQWQGTR